MLLDDEEQRDKRLNRVAYANVGLGLLTLFLWAIPGPGMVPTFWQYIDRDFHSTSEPVVAKIGMALKVVIVLVVVQFWLLSLISLANGFLILKRRRYRLCMIFSGVSLLGTPFHLILGIISLATLGNDWARKRFANGRR
jgi:hypothetical protein